MMKRMIVTVATVVMLFAVGCASTKQVVVRPDEKVLAPGKVQVYVRRPFQLYGCMQQVMIKDNKETIGYLGPRGTLLWEREPGDLQLEAGPTIMNMGDYKPVRTDTEAGKRYIFKVRLPFWYPMTRSGTELLEVQQATPKKSQ